MPREWLASHSKRNKRLDERGNPRFPLLRSSFLSIPFLLPPPPPAYLAHPQDILSCDHPQCSCSPTLTFSHPSMFLSAVVVMMTLCTTLPRCPPSFCSLFSLHFPIRSRPVPSFWYPSFSVVPSLRSENCEQATLYECDAVSKRWWCHRGDGYVNFTVTWVQRVRLSGERYKTRGREKKQTGKKSTPNEHGSYRDENKRVYTHAQKDTRAERETEGRENERD